MTTDAKEVVCCTCYSTMTTGICTCGGTVFNDMGYIKDDLARGGIRFKPLKEVVCCTCYGGVECTCGAAVEITTPKVWVVFDPLYERVVSVHSTEGGAEGRCLKENKRVDTNLKETNRFSGYYLFEVQEFELEG